MARYGEITDGSQVIDMGRYGEIWGDMGRYGEIADASLSSAATRASEMTKTQHSSVVVAEPD